jgi:hypothetical protein
MTQDETPDELDAALDALRVELPPIVRFMTWKGLMRAAEKAKRDYRREKRGSDEPGGEGTL